MAISYPITLPLASDGGNLIESYSLRMVEKIGVSESPFTFKQQFQDYNAMRWELDLTTVPLYGEDARNMRGFLQSLRGRLGRFYFAIPQQLANDFKVNSAAFIGDTDIEVATISGTAPVNHNFTRGTYFSIANRLYMAIEDWDAVSNHEPEITPKLRSNLNSNDTIYTVNPVGIFRLNINDPSYSVNVTEGHKMTISCHEAV